MTKTSVARSQDGTAVNYWIARIEADAAEAKRDENPRKWAALRDSGDIWFIPAVAIWLAIAFAFAWTPFFTLGAVVLGYSLGWSGFFALVATVAIIDTRRDRSIFG